MITEKERFIKQLEYAYGRAKSWPLWRIKEALGDRYKPEDWSKKETK